MTPTQCPECWHAFHEPGPCRVSPGEPCYCGGREPIPVTPTSDPRAALAEAYDAAVRSFNRDRPRTAFKDYLAAAILATLPDGWCGHSLTAEDPANDGAAAEIVAEIARLRRVEEAARFRASVTFTNLDPQPEGPDLLDAIAAWMDRIDDRDALLDQRPHDRSVQADVRRWASGLRAALGPKP